MSPLRQTQLKQPQTGPRRAQMALTATLVIAAVALAVLAKRAWHYPFELACALECGPADKTHHNYLLSVPMVLAALIIGTLAWRRFLRCVPGRGRRPSR